MTETAPATPGAAGTPGRPACLVSHARMSMYSRVQGAYQGVTWCRRRWSSEDAGKQGPTRILAADSTPAPRIAGIDCAEKEAPLLVLKRRLDKRAQLAQLTDREPLPVEPVRPLTLDREEASDGQADRHARRFAAKRPSSSASSVASLASWNACYGIWSRWSCWCLSLGRTGAVRVAVSVGPLSSFSVKRRPPPKSLSSLRTLTGCWTRENSRKARASSSCRRPKRPKSQFINLFSVFSSRPYPLCISAGAPPRKGDPDDCILATISFAVLVRPS